ncbi:MAG: DNA methyltransferase [Deltaproteobacteria bacterium]|nr:DNA methyltransferase [Deltaproteobacteria bacterium]
MPEAEALHIRLKNWAARDWQKETASEGAFVQVFFKEIWGYRAAGEGDKDEGYTLQQQYPVKGAGQGGSTGAADIALGYFGRGDSEGIPQLLGEFKNDRSGLDKPQKGRPNDRSPVDQCLDYLRESRTGLISPILPSWGLVTDMNEFRLYRYGNKAQYQRFVICPSQGDVAVSLLDDSPEAMFHRFLFFRIFHRDWLLPTAGKSKIEKLFLEQITHEQDLENEFYLEYRSFREAVYQALRQCNPRYEKEGRLRQLVRITQRILDRCLFVLYCEDMGQELSFPRNILRDLLIDVASSRFYDSESEEAWIGLKRLFASMRDGTPFASEPINPFNGGLFADDPEMETLRLPNRIFCERNQGDSPGRLLAFPKTLLYFAAKYNFGAADDGARRTLSLTAMGRIFEQSITDLEVMEAHAEGRESLTELTKRKRDGVYYTPEWVTHYIVEETVGTRLLEIRQELGFDRFADVSDDRIEAYRKDGRSSREVGEYEKALHQYRDRLDRLKVVDPACGSGAFLIQAFRYLYEERQWIARELERVTGSRALFDTHAAMRAVLSQNIYGVDINAESVEITRLALWLHTALPDRPLTSLDRTIRCGNSLIGPDFYEQMSVNRDLFGEEACERVNAFDWQEAFPEVFEGEAPGFDCVIGNPPYVKLQHFRNIQEDVAKYLLEAKREDGSPLYESTQTGNFDMYLPFIEKGMELLNGKGKMGYIAPNVWMVNEYGRGLRQKLKRIRRLERWVDFKSFQVFLRPSRTRPSSSLPALSRTTSDAYSRREAKKTSQPWIGQR